MTESLVSRLLSDTTHVTDSQALRQAPERNRTLFRRIASFQKCVDKGQSPVKLDEMEAALWAMYRS